MTKEEFEADAISKGWKPDRYGHLQMVSPTGKTVRLKLQKLSWRLEVKVKPEGGLYYKPPASWVKLRSGYYAKADKAPGFKS